MFVNMRKLKPGIIVLFFHFLQKDLSVSRRNSRNYGRKAAVATNTSPTLTHRCPSPQVSGELQQQKFKKFIC